MKRETKRHRRTPQGKRLLTLLLIAVLITLSGRPAFAETFPDGTVQAAEVTGDVPEEAAEKAVESEGEIETEEVLIGAEEAAAEEEAVGTAEEASETEEADETAEEAAEAAGTAETIEADKAVDAKLMFAEDDEELLAGTEEPAFVAGAQVIMGTNGMPTINIILSKTTLSQIKSGSKDTKYKDNTVNLSVGGSASAQSNVEVKGRGNSTWEYAKKPFQIKFDKKQELFGQGKAKKWILLANAFDYSQLRNDIGLTLANRNGIPGALPRGQHVEVYFNGVYEGLYYLTRKVEVGTVPLKDDKGIIVEIDHIRIPDEPYGTSVGGTRFGTKETVIDSDIMSEQKAVFDSFMTSYNKFEKAVMNRNFAEASKYADMNSFAKHFLLSDFSGGQDMFGSSCYMYKDGDGDVIHAGPMWDFDVSYAGNVLSITKESANPYRTWAYMDVRESPDSKEYVKKWAPLYEYLMNVPEFRELVKKTYRNSVRKTLTDMKDGLNGFSASISAARAKDLARWQPNVSGDAEAASVMSYISSRISYFDFLYGDTVTLNGIYSMKGAYKTENIRAVRTADGYYVILNRAGAALDVAGARKADGTAVQWYNYNGSDAQKWLPLENGGLVSKETGFVLTQRHGGGFYISRAALSGGKPSAAQTFNFIKTSLDISSAVKSVPYVSTGAGNAVIPAIKDYGKTLKEGVDFKAEKNTAAPAAAYTLTGMGDYKGKMTFSIKVARDGGFKEGVFYRIGTKLNRNKVLTVRDGSLANGGNVQLETFSGMLEDYWYFDRQGDGTYIIRNARSGLALDVKGGLTANHTNVQQYTPNGTPAQRFIIDRCTASEYEIVGLGSQKALDVASARTADGTNIQIYTPNNTGAQRWYIEAVGKRPSFSGTYKIVSSLGKADKAVSVAGTSRSSGANILLWTAATSASAAWVVSENGDVNRSWNIRSAYSGLSLDVAGAGKRAGTNVHQYTFGKDNSAQKWVLMEDMNGGTCTVFCVCSGMALDVSGGADKNGANIQMYTPNGTRAQKWVFRKAVQ